MGQLLVPLVSSLNKICFIALLFSISFFSILSIQQDDVQRVDPFVYCNHSQSANPQAEAEEYNNDLVEFKPTFVGNGFGAIRDYINNSECTFDLFSSGELCDSSDEKLWIGIPYRASKKYYRQYDAVLMESVFIRRKTTKTFKAEKTNQNLTLTSATTNNKTAAKKRRKYQVAGRKTTKNLMLTSATTNNKTAAKETKFFCGFVFIILLVLSFLAAKTFSLARSDLEEFEPRVNHGIYISVKSFLASGKSTKNSSPPTNNSQENGKGPKNGSS